MPELATIAHSRIGAAREMPMSTQDNELGMGSAMRQKTEGESIPEVWERGASGWLKRGDLGLIMARLGNILRSL